MQSTAFNVPKKGFESIDRWCLMHEDRSVSAQQTPVARHQIIPSDEVRHNAWMRWKQPLVNEHQRTNLWQMEYYYSFFIISLFIYLFNIFPVFVCPRERIHSQRARTTRSHTSRHPNVFIRPLYPFNYIWSFSIWGWVVRIRLAGD